MTDVGALISALIGTLCAAGGIAARPKTSDSGDNFRTILTAVVAAAPVVVWIIVVGHPLASALGFLLCTVMIGELRDRWLTISTARTTSGESGAPEAPEADNGEPASMLQLK